MNYYSRSLILYRRLWNALRNYLAYVFRCRWWLWGPGDADKKLWWCWPRTAASRLQELRSKLWDPKITLFVAKDQSKWSKTFTKFSFFHTNSLTAALNRTELAALLRASHNFQATCLDSKIAVTMFALTGLTFFLVHLGWKTRKGILKSRVQSLLFLSCQELPISKWDLLFLFTVKFLSLF